MTPSGEILWDFISQVYGHEEVTVADCATREFSDQRRETMNLANAIDKLLRARSRGTSSELPYIKDWHLVLQSKDLKNVEDRIPYHVPDIFKDDCACSRDTASSNFLNRWIAQG